MSAPRTLADDVRSIRELRTGVQAEVYVGWSDRGKATLRVVSNSARVQEALNNLRQVLVDEAGQLLRSAQADTARRGRPAVGQ